MSETEKEEVLISGRYRLVRKIGEGSFGDVFLGEHFRTGENVAVKMARKKSRRIQEHLEREIEVYKSIRGGDGVPLLRWTGEGEEREMTVLVLDLLGPSLEELFNRCSRKFTVKTVLMLADQMIRRVEYLHSKIYLHRDIKPSNFLIGTGSHRDEVYLIDFGLAKKFIDPRTRSHIAYRTDKALIGTAGFTSLGVNSGAEGSRRDDLESLGYVFIYLLRGSLPWDGVEGATKKEKHDKICDMKRSISVDELCKGFPSAFSRYLKTCRGLIFQEWPDYKSLRRMFRRSLEKLGLQNDSDFDWKHLEEKDQLKLESSTSVDAAQEQLGDLQIQGNVSSK